MTLTEFLLARIAEDEAVAGAATSAPWSLDGDGCCIYTPEVGILAEVAIGGGNGTDEDAAHIARHDPARVLAECEAKRRIIADFIEQEAEVEKRHDPDYNDDPWTVGYAAGLERALEHMALPYADHPDYREEWKP